jgi:hypothetical protein
VCAALAVNNDLGLCHAKGRAHPSSIYIWASYAMLCYASQAA